MRTASETSVSLGDSSEDGEMKSGTRAFNFVQTFRGGMFDPHHGPKGDDLPEDTPLD
jgi:hypothetical protein